MAQLEQQLNIAMFREPGFDVSKSQICIAIAMVLFVMKQDDSGTNPMAQSSLLVIGLPYNLFPHSRRSVKGAGGQNLAKLRVSPGHPPH